MNYIAVTCLVAGLSVLLVALIAWVVAVKRLYHEDLLAELHECKWFEGEEQI